MSKKEEKQRPRVDDINKCDTLASVGEYLEDNPFGVPYETEATVHFSKMIYEGNEAIKILELAIYGIKPNFTQFQLVLTTMDGLGGNELKRAHKVLLRIMEIRFELERLV